VRCLVILASERMVLIATSLWPLRSRPGQEPGGWLRNARHREHAVRSGNPDAHRAPAGFQSAKLRRVPVRGMAVSGTPQQIAMAMLPGFGIPQGLPGSKMASSAADWQTSAATQIRWGLGYIQATYGSLCGAWQHESSYGWY
jgi:hypothetical protein